jgi:glucose/arabinose dehydrogenase
VISVRRRGPAGGAESKTSRPRCAAHALALVAALLVVAGQAVGSPERAGAAPSLRLQKVGDFSRPTYIAGAPAFKQLLYVVQQDGKVVVLRSGHRLSKPLLDVSGRVSCCGERGLLSIAFDPRFEKNHLLYAYYTNRQGSIEIDEFRAPTGIRVVPSSRRKVILIPHPGQSNHNGGQLQFGPDGYLYAGTGDGGGSGDTGDNARHLNVLLGKLLRIDPHRRAGHPYTVPASNPFVGKPGRDEIYAYGLRNPYRFSFNPKSNSLAIGDVGQDTEEELDYTKIQRASGANFGWPKWEGDLLFDPNRPDPNLNPPFPVFPILTYTHSSGCAIIGGYVVHDRGLPSLRGRYLYTDLCGGVIRSVVPRLGSATGNQSTGLHLSVPGSFGEGPTGRIYVASQNGPVYRIKQAP